MPGGVIISTGSPRENPIKVRFERRIWAGIGEDGGVPTGAVSPARPSETEDLLTVGLAEARIGTGRVGTEGGSEAMSGRENSESIYLFMSSPL